MKSKGINFLLLVLGLGLLSAYLYSIRDYRFGLDVKGGVRFTYQMDLSKLNEAQRENLDDLRNRVQNTLIQRATGAFGVAEPIIVPKGEDQFVIEVPGYTNIEEARQTIGTSARIEWYHAKNVISEKNPYRTYIDLPDDRSGVPLVRFQRAQGSTGDPIEPGTPAYAAIIEGWGDPLIVGEDIAAAEAQPRGDGYQPSFRFKGQSAIRLENWTRSPEVRNRGEKLAAVLDGRVISIAPLRDNTVLRDDAVIDGQFDAAYVTRLVELIRSGSLPVDLKELSSEQVDPSIGRQALDKMVTAGAIALGITALYLIAYYAFPGFIALIALCLYILFTLTALKLINATFSLAAIAGFILSIGMAVDANILVFERFKEEMKAGRSLMTAIELGFRRAFSAIMDSNACTILTSLVLMALGTGPVKGFATTLVMGVIISLFTAIVVTRSLLVFLVGSGIANNPKFYALDRSWFGEKFEQRAATDPIPIVQQWKKWIAISVISILVGLPFMFMGGLKGNVEFMGGYEAQYLVGDRNVTMDSIASRLEQAGIRGSNVKFGGEGNLRVAIVNAPAEGPLANVSQADAIQRLTEASGFTAADVKGSATVGPAIQAETQRNAILGVIISSVLIVGYLAIRFGMGLGGFRAGMRFGISAILALLHDVLVVLGLTAIVGWAFGWQISALFITSMLTVIGFSVHDTIVIFDRIRENLQLQKPGETFAHIINKSVSQSFARSINTGITVIATLIILLAFGTTTPDLKLFCATMLGGIVSGTYSSIFNAAPILYLWDEWVVKRHGPEQSLAEIARRDIAQQRQIATQVSREAAPTAPTESPNGAPRSYGQVRRRANSAVERSKSELDDI